MITLDDLITVTRIENFDEIKQSILDVIENMDVETIISPEEQISKTDWRGHNQLMLPYVQYIVKPIEDHLLELARKFNYKHMTTVTDGIWFQQYNVGDFHGMHTHGACNFSSVMFVELPEGAATSFNVMGEEFSVDVEEGCIVSFPSFMLHQSKPLAKGRKTIIAFNLNAEGYNETLSNKK